VNPKYSEHNVAKTDLANAFACGVIVLVESTAIFVPIIDWLNANYLKLKEKKLIQLIGEKW